MKLKLLAATLVAAAGLALPAFAEDIKLRIASGHPTANTYVNLMNSFFVPEVTKRVAARTRDLSRSGICLIATAGIPGGDPLVIELVLSLGDNAFSEPLRLNAHVVWCTPIAQSFQATAAPSTVGPLRMLNRSTRLASSRMLPGQP